LFACGVVFALASLVQSGCALLFFGAGAAGGYAISQDEIEGFMDKKYDAVWDASRKVIQREGAILSEDKAAGNIQAQVEKSEVTLKIEQISAASLRVRIQARKSMKLLPDIDLAHNLYNQIIKELA
jgi:hypothetical protein